MPSASVPSAAGGPGSGPPGAAARPRAALHRLYRRDLPHYPATGPRMGYLAIVVAVTVVLYYELYVVFAVAASLIHHFGMTFTDFVWLAVIGAGVGAFASLLAGLADRWGRANMVVYGLLAVAALSTFGLPNAGSKAVFFVLFALLSFVEGVVLVATPALVRDFSPQLGRASAMAYWTMGPVLGSLITTAVTSSTLHGSEWQDQLRYSGLAGFGLFLVALVALRELSPALRDQIMVSLRDRALVEARARGLDPEAVRRGEWRQMMRLDVLGPVLGVGLYLLLYFSAVGNFVVYFATVFGYSERRTNGLMNWYWVADAIALLVAGVLSDVLRVRKPFMMVGAAGSIVMTVLFALRATEPATGYYTFVLLLVLFSAFQAIGYAPWMAAYTETVERHNPAGTAVGLAIWGWILRIVVAVSSAVVPVVVTSATPLMDHGPQVAEAQRRAGPALDVIRAHPEIFAELDRYPPGSVPPELAARALREVGPGGLATVQKARPELAVLKKYGPEVRDAAADAPGQWQTWWWVCLAGQVLFVPLVLPMKGRWSPKRAREDVARHEAAVQRELAALAAERRD
ncbi:MFS transporter [Streptomyces sp. B1866]|uniref:MFS transporter n=1 Tax=Streptomyces sp. B1866 TaxID=3075431 RepID=UPI00288EF6A5|nr:MFS transporter [Streptomyces sp. B1866]MDT3397971.1 MFS transporter [Streptomyces sp. B1866]